MMRWQSREGGKKHTVKVSLIKQLALRLEKHGLSFGDALNLLVSLMTLVSLLAAFVGLYFAKGSLNEARNQAVEARSQAQQASQDQNAQFNKQMDALKEMIKTLSNLKDTSERQLTNQIAEDKIASDLRKAQPSPAFRINCFGSAIVLGSERDVEKVPLAFRDLREDPIIPCTIELWNQGKAELKGIHWHIGVNCGGKPSDNAIIIPVNADPQNPPKSEIEFSFDDLPPAIPHGRVKMPWKGFSLRPTQECLGFFLNSTIESNYAGPGIFTRYYISVQK